MHTLSILLYCAAFSSVLGAQAPYGVIRGSPSSVDNLSALGSNGALSPGSPYNVTSMHLSQIKSKDVFTTLMHPKFPGHQVRVKKSQFCDPTVKSASVIFIDDAKWLTSFKACILGSLTLTKEQSICSSTSSRVDAILTKVNSLSIYHYHRSR